MSNYYEKFKKGLTTSLTVAAATVSRAAEAAKDIAEDVLSLRCLKDYKLAGHVATAGPGNTWKIFTAINKKPGAVFPQASVWILNKKELIDLASRAGRSRGFDSFFELQRRSCSQLVKIKHPGVIKVIEPLEETSNQMVFVTEPVFGSLANLLTQFRDIPTAPEERTSAALSPLEVKYGLCHISDTLHFLHQEARLAHCNLNPSSVIVTQDGGWKLAGFEFFAPIADFGGPSNASVTYEYTSAHPSPWEEYCAPSLPYTAPELVGGCLASSDVSLSGAADCFSLAALTYQLLTGKQVLPVGSSTGEYRSRLSMLASADMSGIAGNMQPLLRMMLSPSASARPNAAAFNGCQWFSEDMLLRCLKFLDNILQRDSGQKVAFMKDLSTFWQQFDDRLLQHRVLPPIVQELRNDVVALAALPVVLAIMGRMKPDGFAASGILPVLKPIFEHADGEVMLALVKHANVFYNLMPSEAHATVLVPLMIRAFDSNNTRAQEETLKALQRLAPEMPYTLLRESLMPRVVGLCLRTTSLVVRTSALALMAQAAHRLDKEAAAAMLDVCSQIVAVDRSAGTAMAVLRLGEAVGKHYGPEITCQKVLPLLCPLLVSPSLNSQLFSGYISVVRSLLDRVAEKTGSALAAAGDAAGTATAAAAVSAKTAPLLPSRLDGTGLGGSTGSLGGLQSQPSSTGAAGRSPTAAWDTPLATSSTGSTPKSSNYSSSTFSSSTAAPAAQAAAAASWSSAAWSSSSTGPTAGGTATNSTPAWTSSSSAIPSSSAPAWGSSSTVSSSNPSWGGGRTAGSTPTWGGSIRGQQQQQQQRLQQAGSGVSPGMPAPDIFSSGAAAGAGDMLSGLSLEGQNTSGRGSSSGSATGLGNGFGGVGGGADLFGGLAMSGAAVGGSSGWSGGGRASMQQPQAAMPLAPPPAAPTRIGIMGSSQGVGASSSSRQDPFAGLITGSNSSSRPNAAGATVGTGFDPFSSLAAAPASSTADPYAGLAGGSMATGVQQRQQQQQQQWSGGGDLLM